PLAGRGVCRHNGRRIDSRRMGALAGVAREGTSAPLAGFRLGTGRRLTVFPERGLAEELSLARSDGAERLAPPPSEARVDLNPHQVEAAAFALDTLLRGGCVLADEVGLGKTIEAGLVIAQLLAEGQRHILIICPASLRAQWQLELQDKFALACPILDG